MKSLFCLVAGMGLFTVTMHALPAKIGLSGIPGISDRERSVAPVPEPLWVGGASTSIERERRLGGAPEEVRGRAGTVLPCGFPLPMSSDERCIERQRTHCIQHSSD